MMRGTMIWMGVIAMPLGLFAQKITGTYVLTGQMEMASQLELKPDGTFEYAFIYGAADYMAKGKWRQDGSSVLLNTEPKEQPAFRALSSAATKGNEIRVHVNGANGRGVEHINVSIRNKNDHQEARTSHEGIATFEEFKNPEEIVFLVPVYNVPGGPFKVNSAHDDFYFEINGEAIVRVPFKDERLVIDKKALVLLYWSKDHPMRYERR
jgi:hypothetical protein